MFIQTTIPNQSVVMADGSVAAVKNFPGDAIVLPDEQKLTHSVKSSEAMRVDKISEAVFGSAFLYEGVLMANTENVLGLVEGDEVYFLNPAIMRMRS